MNRWAYINSGVRADGQNRSIIAILQVPGLFSWASIPTLAKTGPPAWVGSICRDIFNAAMIQADYNLPLKANNPFNIGDGHTGTFCNGNNDPALTCNTTAIWRAFSGRAGWSDDRWKPRQLYPITADGGYLMPRGWEGTLLYFHAQERNEASGILDAVAVMTTYKAPRKTWLRYRGLLSVPTWGQWFPT